jgi:hypothetical protein
MEWLSSELLFELFHADSGIIPWVYRVCKLYRDTSREFIRLYKNSALTVNVTTGTDKTIYTVTSDGKMNGIHIVYGYNTISTVIDNEYNIYLAPIEITEMCMNKRHGRSIVFNNGDCVNINYYEHGIRIQSDQYIRLRMFDVNCLWHQLYDNQSESSYTSKKSWFGNEIKIGNIIYHFDKNGRIRNKIQASRFLDSFPKYTKLFMSYDNGDIRFTLNIYKQWITECIYYNMDGSIKMTFMQQYSGCGSREVYLDNGYTFHQSLRRAIVEVDRDISVIDASGSHIIKLKFGQLPIRVDHNTPLDQHTRGDCCNVKSPQYCKICDEHQMRREFGVMWGRIDAVIRAKSYKETSIKRQIEWLGSGYNQ